MRAARPSGAVLVAALWVFAWEVASGTVLTPASDEQVIEVLPAVSGSRAEVVALRRSLAADPRNSASAVKLSALYLEQARSAGDPRFVGQALAVLSPWSDPESAPDDVLLMVATLQQYLHDFDTAASNLELIVRRQPRHAQAWLTLATIRRVQGRYEASDRACDAVAAAGAGLYARACTAENESLRGDVDGARREINSILAGGVTAGTRNWLLTTLAENEARAGREAPAETAYRAALEAQSDSYTLLSLADFYIALGRYSDALQTLSGQTRTDAVLLRLAIAGVGAKTAASDGDVKELRERMNLANLRPEARVTHAREQAMFALWIDANPREALGLARVNVRHQREPLDLLILAQSAAAAKDASATREVALLVKEMGLKDVRLNAQL